MKIGKTVKWMFLFAISNLSAQNNYSIDFGINAQPTENIKSNEVSLEIDYSKTFDTKVRIANEFKFNSKKINYFNYDFSNSLTEYYKIRNKFALTYLKSEKLNFNFEIEPFIASEYNLNVADIDLLGGLSIDFILSPKKEIRLGLSRNTSLGKPKILPVFSYYYAYNKEFSFSIGFPETNIKYSNNPRNSFYIKNSFTGDVYNLENTFKSFSLNSTKSSFSQQTTSLEYERNMDANWFVNFKVGYDFNRKYLLQDSNYNTTFDFNIKDGCNFGITIKYKH
ncbi:MAG: DUF6268 family outer membrane beta-barrel protein [Flavobacterium sp.]|uniref:DUF6268 family outer membrane beta-barrel protein n=1 Tax=Flavobacterium sp. TaxID=239 RepID=UPI00261CA668|nr:DUF6268 family outer membrane beta-barrel protein [Flavobacterium sp.]MDD5149238.1 DUF6268 family outer membrane beta-barrel protein [Flavobacterium sp.]